MLIMLQENNYKNKQRSTLDNREMTANEQGGNNVRKTN